MNLYDEDDDCCRCGHSQETHDPVTDRPDLGGACGACECDEYRLREDGS